MLPLSAFWLRRVARWKYKKQKVTDEYEVKVGKFPIKQQNRCKKKKKKNKWVMPQLSNTRRYAG